MENAPREELIATAVKFLLNPKVLPSPLEQKKLFLTQKGLTTKEIELALERTGADATDVSRQASGSPYLPAPLPQPETGFQRAKDLATSVVVIGSLSYGVFRILRWLWPQWFGRSREEEAREHLEARMTELQESLTEVLGSVQKSVQEQNHQLEQILDQETLSKTQQQLQSTQTADEIKSEVKSLKSLLLSRNQFALASTSSTPTLPAWQQISQPSATSSDSKLDNSDNSSSYVAVNGTEDADDKSSETGADESEIISKIDVDTSNPDVTNIQQSETDSC